MHATLLKVNKIKLWHITVNCNINRLSKPEKYLQNQRPTYAALIKSKTHFGKDLILVLPNRSTPNYVGFFFLHVLKGQLIHRNLK